MLQINSPRYFIFLVGLPDPPQNVQCELGPQDGTLLVTWTPVINSQSFSSKLSVSGYLVFTDGKLATEITSPTGDHAVLHWSTLCTDPPLFVTVKTKTRDGSLSADSETIRVPRAIGQIRSRTIEGLNVSTSLPAVGLPSATSVILLQIFFSNFNKFCNKHFV